MKLKCEHDLYVTENGAVQNGGQCDRTVMCILCRSCGTHCHGHSQLRDGLKWRQFEYIESSGKSESHE